MKISLNSNSVEFSINGIFTGAKAILPVALAVFPFGVSFGVSAIEAGVEPTKTIHMSALVFAGAAQFSVLKFWSDEIPLIPLIFTVLAINARNIILGFGLSPWIGNLPIYRIALITPILSDANWAYSMRAYEDGERDVGVLVGSGLILWLSWVIGTATGINCFSFFDSPDRFGLDLLMPIFFITVLYGMAKQKILYFPWIAAGAASLLMSSIIDGSWYIIIGALIGGAVGVINDRT
jgi:predicted branched-subunit amino acid permease